MLDTDPAALERARAGIAGLAAFAASDPAFDGVELAAASQGSPSPLTEMGAAAICDPHQEVNLGGFGSYFR